MTPTSASDDDERELLRRACHGDDGAFETLYRRHGGTVYALVLRMTGHPATAEDVLQDTFLRALEQGASYRGQAPLRSWLKRIAANAAIDRLRRDRRLVALEQAEAQAAGAPVERAGQVAEVLGLLAHLDPAARSVVWLHEMEGYSHPEIAALFGHSESWSKSLLARSLERLRSELEKQT